MRPEDSAARGAAELGEVVVVFKTLVAEPRLFVRGQRRRVPVLHRNQAALKSLRFRTAAQRIDRGVTHPAMAEAFDQISAPIPFRRFGRIGLVYALVQEQRAPSKDQRAVVEGKLQI